MSDNFLCILVVEPTKDPIIMEMDGSLKQMRVQTSRLSYSKVMNRPKKGAQAHER